MRPRGLAARGGASQLCREEVMISNDQFSMTNFQSREPTKVSLPAGNREFAIEYLSLAIQCIDGWSKISLRQKEGSTKLRCARREGGAKDGLRGRRFWGM